jgi:hypothetical protein
MKSLYREPCFCLAFLWRCAHLDSSRAFAAKSSSAMFFDPTNEQRLASLEQRLGLARAITPELMSDVIAQACPRFAAHGAAVKAAVNRLIESRAFTDAALAVLELELPQWRLRRIVHEDGEWHCSLSRIPLLPIELGEIAEAGHEILALAILIALIEARRAVVANETSRAAAPGVRQQPGSTVCCDNFG